MIADGDFLLGVCHRGKLNHIAAGLQRQLCDLADNLLELSVARYEVGLGINLDDSAGLCRRCHADEPFGGDAVRFLRGLR